MAEDEIRRGAFYMRPRKFILQQAGTGGYGIRPYVFEAAEHGAVAHVTAPFLFVESKNKKHIFVKIKACATDFLENQKFSMDL